MRGRIIQGDALEKLKELSDDSIDLVVTDPPYGYSFMGKAWDRGVPCTDIWKECLRVLKAGAFALIMSAPRQDVQCQMIMNLRDAGFRLDFTPLYWAYASGFPKAMNISKAVDKKLGAEREVIGHETKPDSTFHTQNVGGTIQGVTTYDITAPSSPQAKSLDGSYGGFQPKPAVEIILVAMKPLSEKTFTDQAMKNQKGITWLDDVRIPTREKTQDCGSKTIDSEVSKIQGNMEGISGVCPADLGRFPANLLVSDDVLNDGKERGGGGYTFSGYRETEGSGGSWRLSGNKNAPDNYGDSGSFSRYFSLDAWAKKLPRDVQKTYPFLIVPKASSGEKNDNMESWEDKCETDGCIRSNKKNFHPTVKPLQLMQYLVTLGSRQNDTVLDPFIGSGTTGLACEMLGRNWIGIEISEEYCKIAEARLSEWKGQTRLTEVMA